MWTQDTTSDPWIGLTGHWVQVDREDWRIRSEVLGLRIVMGNHGGENLGRFMLGMLDRVGVTAKNHDGKRAINKVHQRNHFALMMTHSQDDYSSLVRHSIIQPATTRCVVSSQQSFVDVMLMTRFLPRKVDIRKHSFTPS